MQWFAALSGFLLGIRSLPGEHIGVHFSFSFDINLAAMLKIVV
jgi:hypothetical protein